MNKKVLILLGCFIVVCLFVLTYPHLKQIHSNNNIVASSSQNQTELQYNQKLSILTSNILNSQKSTSLKQLDCNKITDSQFISIGEIFLDMMFGNQHVREQIAQSHDSQNVTQAYGEIGKYYLTCPNNWTSTFPSSQTQQAYGDTLNSQINNILKTQNINSVKQLDCQKVTPAQFISIGDARMDLMIGDEEVHVHIDKLIGEKGLQSMKVSHIQSGKSALGCK